jgi:serine/threonine protein kinase
MAAAVAPSVAVGVAASDPSHLVRGYRVYKELGHGSFSHVFLAQHQLRGQTVAIKEIRLSDTERWSFWTLREVSILQQLRHPNIVQVLDYGVLPGRIYIVCEAAERDLRRFLNRRTTIDQALNRVFLRQIFMAVAFCHERDVVHRDLKPENVLLFPGNVVKIADFGLAKVLSLRAQVSTPGCVTLWYRPPEILLNNARHSAMVDSWSLGCMVAEMVTGHVPFNGENEAAQLTLIVDRLGAPTPLEVTAMRGAGNLDDSVTVRAATTPEERSTSEHTRAKFMQRLSVPSAAKLVSQLLVYAPETRMSPGVALKECAYLAATTPSGGGGPSRTTGGVASAPG